MLQVPSGPFARLVGVGGALLVCFLALTLHARGMLACGVCDAMSDMRHVVWEHAGGEERERDRERKINDDDEVLASQEPHGEWGKMK